MNQPMNSVAKIASVITLGLTTVPCLLYFAGVIELDTVKWTGIIGTIGWFIATPIWMSAELPIDASEVEL